MLMQKLKQFTRKAIERMQSIAELDLLFVSTANSSPLQGPGSDSIVLVFDLSSYALRMRLDQARGTSCFCVQREIEQIPVVRRVSESVSLPEICATHYIYHRRAQCFNALRLPRF